ncbi:Hypp1662 [Branchiostoma lanceolatum]|uniref:Hypp1662 protein n=1 Tax=Branchiostoma lanceolatum TaxID=7740 RepID=A0A8J9ZJM4_BRALA|nr:Hypp1662 [Branchiostoma lanceolatum]
MTQRLRRGEDGNAPIFIQTNVDVTTPVYVYCNTMGLQAVLGILLLQSFLLTCHGELAYLTTWDGWGFYKVKAVGNMTNTNVKATCEAAGMRLPCFYTGHGRCTLWWTSDCIAFDHDELDCRTPLVLSTKMCVTIFPHNCERLDDTFVYMPGWHGGDTAWGVDYDTNSWALLGAHYSDKYALCAVESPNNVITG